MDIPDAHLASRHQHKTQADRFIFFIKIGHHAHLSEGVSVFAHAFLHCADNLVDFLARKDFTFAERYQLIHLFDGHHHFTADFDFADPELIAFTDINGYADILTIRADSNLL